MIIMDFSDRFALYTCSWDPLACVWALTSQASRSTRLVAKTSCPSGAHRPCWHESILMKERHCRERRPVLSAGEGLKEEAPRRTRRTVPEAPAQPGIPGKQTCVYTADFPEFPEFPEHTISTCPFVSQQGNIRNSTAWVALIQKVGHKYPWIKLLELMAGRVQQSTQIPHGLFFFSFWSFGDENTAISKSLSLGPKEQVIQHF